MEERNKIENYIENDRLNLEKIVDEYSGYVYKVVKNMVGKNITEEDEEEIIADTFFILWKNTEKLDKEKQITSYIAGVARNLVREKTRVININCDIADYENVIRDLKDIDMVYEEREKTELIRKATNQLKQEDITIFNLYYYSSRKIKEIANIMNIPEFKVKSRLYRIRKKLKKELEKGGYSYDGLRKNIREGENNNFYILLSRGGEIGEKIK